MHVVLFTITYNNISHTQTILHTLSSPVHHNSHLITCFYLLQKSNNGLADSQYYAFTLIWFRHVLKQGGDITQFCQAYDVTRYYASTIFKFPNTMQMMIIDRQHYNQKYKIINVSCLQSHLSTVKMSTAASQYYSFLYFLRSQ